MIAEINPSSFFILAAELAGLDHLRQCRFLALGSLDHALRAALLSHPPPRSLQTWRASFWAVSQQAHGQLYRALKVNGEVLGAVMIDQRGCRPVGRSVYVDRPGAVFSMCIDDLGLIIERFVISDVSGLPLPLVDTLNDREPWSPSALQAAPG